MAETDPKHDERWMIVGFCRYVDASFELTFTLSEVKLKVAYSLTALVRPLPTDPQADHQNSLSEDMLMPLKDIFIFV